MTEKKLNGIELIKKVVSPLCSRYKGIFSFDDLVSFGSVGYAKALNTHDPAKANIETYSQALIEKAVSDEIRQEDYLSRGQRQHCIYVSKMNEYTGGKIPYKYPKKPPEPIYIEELAEDEEGECEGKDRYILDYRYVPEDMIEKRIEIENINCLIKTLPPKEQHVINAYLDDKSTREIGDELALTESRILQIKKEAKHNIKDSILFGDYKISRLLRKKFNIKNITDKHIEKIEKMINQMTGQIRDIAKGWVEEQRDKEISERVGISQPMAAYRIRQIKARFGKVLESV